MNTKEPTKYYVEVVWWHDGSEDRKVSSFRYLKKVKDGTGRDFYSFGNFDEAQPYYKETDAMLAFQEFRRALAERAQKKITRHSIVTEPSIH